MADEVPKPEGLCGRCGYSRIGSSIKSLTCPECGANFRDVGIYTDAYPSARSIPWLIVKGAVIAGFLFFLWSASS